MSANVGNALLRGAFWSAVLRWGVRGIGMVSTVVLARLLTPADYGVVAMATLFMGLIETFLDADASNALLRSPNREAAFTDTAWTMRVFQAMFLAAIVAVAAPFAARYFEEPRLTPVLWVFCANTLLNGLSSLGPILARRDLDFMLEVRLTLITRIVTFFLTIGLALWLRTYWALVLGVVGGSAVGLVLGYAMHPYRPRLRTTYFREIFGFSQWMLVQGIAIFFARKVDGFVVGRVGSAADLGAYNVALELGQMITAELGLPLNRALVPVLSSMHGDEPRMRAALMKTVAVVNTATLPVGIGMAMVAPQAVEVLLGPQWTATVPLLAIFAVMSSIRFTVGPYGTLFVTLGLSRRLAMLSWIELGIFAVALYLARSYGLMGFAYARTVAVIVVNAIWLVVGHRMGLRFGAFCAAIARPALGSLAMAAVLHVLPSTGSTALVELVWRVAVGSIVYVFVIVSTWFAVGRPDGLEAIVFDRFKRVWDRRANAAG